MSQHQPLFVDTNAFVALFNEDDTYYESANAVMDGIRDGDLAYGPIFTSRFVISETVTTLLYGTGHREAIKALQAIRESATFNILEVTEPIFAKTAAQFEEFDDQQISFVDHLNAVFSEEFDIDHIFAFEDDFATLDLTRVPVDTGEV